MVVSLVRWERTLGTFHYHIRAPFFWDSLPGEAALKTMAASGGIINVKEGLRSSLASAASAAAARQAMALASASERKMA